MGSERKEIFVGYGLSESVPLKIIMNVFGIFFLQCHRIAWTGHLAKSQLVQAYVWWVHARSVRVSARVRTQAV